MDSLNLPETQNTSLNSKYSASSPSPIACACCGSKYYIQNLPQLYYFRVQNPEIPKCKHAQDCFEENCKNTHPGFPPFPILHPFFHNSPFPAHPYVHIHVDDAAIKQEKNEYPSERENVSHLSNHDAFCQREKGEFRGNKNSINEGTHKYPNVPGPETPIPGYPCHLIDPKLHSVFQTSGWGDFTPWTCSPFIAPMISYCLFWNSQKLIGNPSLKNCTGNLADNLLQKCNENTNETNSSCDNDNKEVSEGFDKEYDNGRAGSTEIKRFSGEDFEQVKNDESKCQIQENITDVFLNSQLNYSNSIENMEKEEETAEFSKTSSDSFCRGDGGEDAEMEGFDSAVQVESEECFKIDEKNLLNYKTSSSLSIGPNETIKSNRSQSEICYLMARKSSENAMDVSTSELQVNSSSASGADENAFLPLQDNENEEKPSGEVETSTHQERMSYKKAFKNFTIADQTKDGFFVETNASVAAAGDLGGENCVGYKVTIETSDFEKDGEEKVCQETEPEEGLESNEAVPQDSETQINKNTIIPEKNTKSTRYFKSGIAKLSNTSKLKESKTYTIKTLKHNKESNHKELESTKRKHYCIISNSTVNAKENSSKIQKTRICTVAQQKTTGPEKQHKEANSKSQSIKKEKKFQRLKS